MTDHIIPSGPTPIFCAWFDREVIESASSKEEAKENVHISPVIAWIYDADGDRLPIPITAFDGAVRGPEQIRHLDYSYDEAKMNGEVMAMSRYTTLSALRQRPRIVE